MKNPYREEDASAEHGPSELLYRASDPDRSVAPARSAIQLSIAGAFVSGFVAMAGYATPAALVLGGFVGAGIWRWRRSPEATGVMFSVHRGELTVKEKVSGKVLARARLQDVLDVRLDTKEIHKVVPGSNAVPGVRFINSEVAPGVDVARIVLVLGNEATPIRLTEQFLAHMDSVEWTGKIRSFLRRQGWTPEDERAPDEASEED